MSVPPELATRSMLVTAPVMIARPGCDSPRPRPDEDRRLEGRIGETEHLELIARDVGQVQPIGARMIQRVSDRSAERQRARRAGDDCDGVDPVDASAKLGISASAVRVSCERLHEDRGREMRVRQLQPERLELRSECCRWRRRNPWRRLHRQLPGAPHSPWRRCPSDRSLRHESCRSLPSGVVMREVTTGVELIADSG